MEERELVPGTVYPINEINFREENLRGLYLGIDLSKINPHVILFKRDEAVRRCRFSAYVFKNSGNAISIVNAVEHPPKENEKEDLESRLKMAGL